MTCNQSSTIIYQLLSQASMFPTGSRLHECVTSCFGNGLKALKMIIQTSHPAYIDQPSTHITNYPKQRELSLLEHKKVFDDYHQMRAMINGFSKDLDDEQELDIFIMNMKCSEFEKG